MDRLTTIEIYKEEMKFSAGHFTVFNATERERLHGHNFTVQAEITGRVKAGIYKKKLIELCRAHNEYFLLPLHSPHLKVEARGERIVAHFAGEEILFPKQDVLLLPVANVTVEELSNYLLGKLLEFKNERSDGEVLAMVIKVFTGPGQGASASWRA
jgi:6-pyruvoyltetrahydropterin/6-carboxytetrahydropterin synthase